MCGIVGYIGYRDAKSVILKGLRRLEYRGYDSAGIALYDGKNVKVTKTKGKVDDLEAKLKTEENKDKKSSTSQNISQANGETTLDIESDDLTKEEE